jgi:4-amino-4-deoxy-L-arabinose transferase-like glycosyltransferase
MTDENELEREAEERPEPGGAGVDEASPPVEPPDPNDQLTTDMLPRVQMTKPDWRISLGVLLVCVGIYVPVMGSYGMFDPWETHYTEVARQFMVRNNWMETYWHNGRGPEGFAETNFWSKPVGSFWMSGLSLKLFGYSEKTTGKEIATGKIEWAVRLPFFLCGLFGIFCVYLMCTRLFNRRTGAIAAVILATAPMYFMITRQAMTDIPYVGLITGGLALFMLGIFGHREALPRKSVKIKRWTLSWPHAASYYLFLGAFILFMVLQLNAIMDALRRIPLPLTIGGGKPLSMAVLMVIYIVIALVFIWMSRKTKTKNEVYLYSFYMATGIAGLAKGLIGALQPGMIILLYLLTSREWRVLADVAMTRGLLVAVCIFFPWYHGMVARFGKAFWNELFGTEQLRRLTIGEQAQARGTYEYYLNEIGYGLFPWVAFLPAALARIFNLRLKERSPRDRARLFAFVWLLGTIALFTLTITKYHHYILPAIPPAAILIAVYLDDLIERRASAVWLGLLTAVGVLSIVAIDLVKQPARWVWMYTYLYDNNWARGVPKGTPILYYSIAFGFLLLLFFLPRLRRTALWLALAASVVGGGYVLNWYQLGVAPNWSQKSAITSYYKLRKGPEEELVAWQFNWRGETWYTGAEVVVSKSLDNAAIIAYLKERLGRRFFFITERSRYPSLRAMLPSEKGRKTLKIVDDTNVHYVLAAADL